MTVWSYSVSKKMSERQIREELKRKNGAFSFYALTLFTGQQPGNGFKMLNVI